MKKFFIYSAAAIFILAGAAFTIQEIINWKIDNENAQVKFTMQAHGKEMVGNFKGVKGEIKFDEKDLANSSFNCSIDVSTINTGVSERDGHLQGAKWFDAANHPTINFTSSKIEKTDKGYNVIGTLSIKGITKDIIIPFTFKEALMAGLDTSGNFSGDFTIKRSDFGIGKTDGDVSDEVALHLEIPVTKEK
ncbi:MAG: YceI family protein [Chitinophagaceae bacterium]|nr:YceI family protein [Chitinophagaceae bacterium]